LAAHKRRLAFVFYSQLLSAEASISDDACPSARSPNFDPYLSISPQTNFESMNDETASNLKAQAIAASPPIRNEGSTMG
jgi:hypothetical protein